MGSENAKQELSLHAQIGNSVFFLNAKRNAVAERKEGIANSLRVSESSIERCRGFAAELDDAEMFSERWLAIQKKRQEEAKRGLEAVRELVTLQGYLKQEEAELAAQTADLAKINNRLESVKATQETHIVEGD